MKRAALNGQRDEPMSVARRWIPVLGLLAGCSDSPSTPPVSLVASVDVAPDAVVVEVGRTAQLSATVRNQQNAPIAGRSVTWSSDDPAIARVSTSGLVTGVAAGATTVRATLDGKVGTALLTVVQLPPASCTSCLEVHPAAVLLTTIGAEQELTAFAVDAAGTRTPVTATFQSSQPSAVSVTSGGLLTAVAALGSSQVVAQANGLTSAPVLVLVAPPAAGALLVSDPQIVGTPQAVDPTAEYEVGWRERFELRDAVPAVGQIVLGTGGLPIGGRVTAVGAPAGGVVQVEYELVPLGTLFDAISINQNVPLANAAVLQASPTIGAALVESSFSLGPFECEAKLDGGLTLPITLDLFSFSIDPDLTLDLVIDNGDIQRFVVHGTLAARLTANPLLKGAVKGSAGCKAHLRTLILPIGGPVARFVGGQVPLGLGFGLEAKTEIGELGFDAFLESSANTAMGFDCAGGCQAVAELTANHSGFIKPIVPSLPDDLRTELAGSFFGYAELQIGSPLLRQLQFKIIEVKAGLEQKAELATERAQALDPAYASSFKLVPVLEAGTSSKVSALAGLLKVQLASFKLAASLPVLARSPVGTFTIEPASVQAGNADELGDLATFTVSLDPVSYFGAYAVDRVEIRWLRDGAGGKVLEAGRPGCTGVTASSGQTVFTCQTDFLQEHQGEQTFFAFVRPKLFGVAPPLGLEIGRATVTVGAEPPFEMRAFGGGFVAANRIGGQPPQCRKSLDQPEIGAPLTGNFGDSCSITFEHAFDDDRGSFTHTGAASQSYAYTAFGGITMQGSSSASQATSDPDFLPRAHAASGQGRFVCFTIPPAKTAFYQLTGQLAGSGPAGPLAGSGEGSAGVALEAISGNVFVAVAGSSGPEQRSVNSSGVLTSGEYCLRATSVASPGVQSGATNASFSLSLTLTVTP